MKENSLTHLDLVRLSSSQDQTIYMVDNINYHKQTLYYILSPAEGQFFEELPDKLEKVGRVTSPMYYGGTFRIKETSEIFMETGGGVFVCTGLGYYYASGIWSFAFEYNKATYCVGLDEIEILSVGSSEY